MEELKKLILQLKTENWSKKDVNEKYDLLQKIANGICAKRGLPHIDIIFKFMDENTGAAYIDLDKKILFNIEKIYFSENATEFLEHISHECRHYEQDIKRIYDLNASYDLSFYSLIPFEQDAFIYSFYEIKDNFYNLLEGDDTLKNKQVKEIKNLFINYMCELFEADIVDQITTKACIKTFLKLFEDKLYYMNYEQLKAYIKDTQISEDEMVDKCIKKFLSAEEFSHETDKLKNEIVKGKNRIFADNILDFAMPGVYFSQRIKVRNVAIEIEQTKRCLRASIYNEEEKKNREASLAIFIKDDNICEKYSQFTDNIPDVNTMKIVEKIIIEHYEQFNGIKVKEPVFFKPFILDSIEDLRFNKIFTEKIDEKLMERDYEKIKKIFYKKLYEYYSYYSTAMPKKQCDEDYGKFLEKNVKRTIIDNVKQTIIDKIFDEER